MWNTRYISFQKSYFALELVNLIFNFETLGKLGILIALQNFHLKMKNHTPSPQRFRKTFLYIKSSEQIHISN